MDEDIRITVIATGFDAISQRKPYVAGKKKTIEFPVQRFDQDDLDIPAFLRRR